MAVRLLLVVLAGALMSRRLSVRRPDDGWPRADRAAAVGAVVLLFAAVLTWLPAGHAGVGMQVPLAHCMPGRHSLPQRPQFRKQFKNFEIGKAAKMTEADIERLLLDAGIIRHRGKIASTINNAKRALEIQQEFGSLAAYVWRFEPDETAAPELGGRLASETEASRALSKDLRQRGFSFVGPTTSHAFMQAMGLVNDHYSHCFARAECDRERKRLKRPQ